mgnify:CR=1 FL=1|jgi:hypothetical protein
MLWVERVFIFTFYEKKNKIVRDKIICVITVFAELKLANNYEFRLCFPTFKLLQLFYVENNFHFYRLIVFCDQNNSV